MKKAILAALAALALTACSAGPAGSAGLTDGSYLQTVRGFHGDIAMTVRIAGSKIADVTVDSHTEEKDYGQRSVDELPGRIVAAQSLGVDATTGATITSRAIFRGVAEAITAAGGDPAKYGYKSAEEISMADEIRVVGLPDGKEATVTGADLMKFPPIEVEATSVNASGEKNDVKARGVTLETLLQSLGASQKDYEAIIASATDGYSIEYPKAVLQSRDIVIAYEVNGELQSPRIVVPDERAMYWIKFLSLLELKGEMQKAPVKKIVVMETAFEEMESEEYKLYDRIENAVKISSLLQKYFTAKSEFVSFAASDGLEKNEKYDTFAAQYIVTTGATAPLYIGPSLPEGMRVKGMLFAKVGGETVVSVATAMKIAGVTGELPLEKLLEAAGIAQAAEYELAGADGHAVTIAAIDAANARVILEEGGVTLRFTDREDGTAIHRLLTILAS